MKPRRPGPKRPKKTDAAPVRHTKPASERKAPEHFPVLVGIGKPARTFPGELLDNGHCLEIHGRGLASMAERGGLSPFELAGNLRRLTLEQCHAMSREEAERIVSEATVSWWRGAKVG